MDYRQEFLDSLELGLRLDSFKTSVMSQHELHKSIAKKVGTDSSKTEKLLYHDLEYNFRFRFNRASDILNHSKSLFNNTNNNEILEFPKTLAKDTSILDYGAGAAEFSLALCLNGYTDITLAELPNMSFKWLQFIAKKEGLPIKFIEIVNDNELVETYDYITCSEMIEHVWDPIKIMKYLIEHLKDGSYMYLSHFFNDLGGDEPFHLTHNNIFSHDNYFAKLLETLGLFVHKNDMNGCAKIYRKQAPKIVEKEFVPITEEVIRRWLPDDTFRTLINDMTRVKAQNQNLDQYIEHFINIYFKKEKLA